MPEEKSKHETQERVVAALISQLESCLTLLRNQFAQVRVEDERKDYCN